jgi:hypothetical protein
MIGVAILSERPNGRLTESFYLSFILYEFNYMDSANKNKKEENHNT